MNKSIINIFTFLPVELCDIIYQYSKPNYIPDISKNICKLRHIYPIPYLDNIQEYKTRITFFCKDEDKIISQMLELHKSIVFNKQDQFKMIYKVIELMKCKITIRSYRLFEGYCDSQKIKICQNYPNYRTKLLHHLWVNNIQIKPRMNIKKIKQLCLSF